ncbi:metallophosphoesterase [Actinophytocola sp.]|uniref:metallophosphoesterase family protein n=1 Tax=Actinophytocola sp. TaxID=1872138 RepID=UPI00389AD206
MIRIAAVGDVHLGEDARGLLRPALENLPEHADVLLLAGDLTRHGTLDEARVVADEFADLAVPVVAVLGNHDYHGNVPDDITKLLEDSGMRVLEGDAVTLSLDGGTLGVAGVKGFGGGFAGKCASNFGEPEMKAFVEHTIERAERLREALASLDTDVKVALTHYSPIPETLRGEPPEIYPFLGCYQLGEVIDACDVDIALHGHAHFGCEQGVTPGGTRVRNVAQPVIRSAYACYCLDPVTAG